MMRYCPVAKVGSIDAPFTMKGFAMKMRRGITIISTITAKRITSPIEDLGGVLMVSVSVDVGEDEKGVEYEESFSLFF